MHFRGSGVHRPGADERTSVALSSDHSWSFLPLNFLYLQTTFEPDAAPTRGFAHAKQISELTCRAGGRDGVEIRFACTDYRFPDVCSRTAADVDRQGGGGRGSRCADLLRRDDGPTQMRRATAKATCSRRA